MPAGRYWSLSCATSAAAYALRSAGGRPRSTSRSQPNSCAQPRRAPSSRMKGLNQNRLCSRSAAALQCRSRRRQCVNSCSTISCCWSASKPRKWRGSSRRGRNKPSSIGDIGTSTSTTASGDACAVMCGAKPACSDAASARPLAASASSKRWARCQRHSACTRPSRYSTSHARPASRTQADSGLSVALDVSSRPGAGAAATAAWISVDAGAAVIGAAAGSTISMIGITRKFSAGGHSIARNTAATATCPHSHSERCCASAGRVRRHNTATAHTAPPAASEPAAASSRRARTISRSIGIMARRPHHRASVAAVVRADRVPARPPACCR